MRDGYRLFDTHTHIGIARHSARRRTAAELLRHMDALGIDRSVAIPFPIVEDHRSAHDEIGRAVAEHPGRLVGSACISPFIPERDFRDEVRRCREQYGFRALKIQPQYQALNPLAASSDFLFESALENGMALIVHTGAGAPYALPSLWMPAARKFPALPFVLGHAGGGVFTGEAIVAALFCPNVYIEVSTLMPHHVLEVLKHVPAARLMIGSDLPENVEAEFGKILGLCVSDADRREVLFGTANRVFDGDGA